MSRQAVDEQPVATAASDPGPWATLAGVRKPAFDAARSPEVIVGTGAFGAIGEVCDRLGARRVFLVAGRSVDAFAVGLAQRLGRRAVGRYTDPRRHVPAHDVSLAVGSAQEVHADAVVTVGGGSATGFGKIIALSLRLPLIAVPTSYVGAEMTSRYLVATDRGMEAGTSVRALPRVVVHDPALPAGLPDPQIASSGMTAVASCLAALARGGVAAPVADTARLSLNLLWDGLPALLHGDRSDALRAEVLGAASLAGIVLEQTGPGLGALVAEELGAALGADTGAALGCLTACLLASAGAEGDPARAALHHLDGGMTAAEALADFRRELGLPDRLGLICGAIDPDIWARRCHARPRISKLADADHLAWLMRTAA